MFAVKPLTKIAPPFTRTAVVRGPPSERISLKDKFFHGILMSAIFLSVPMYITYMIPKFRDRNK